jgi:pyruvate dehydrogenase (quinone)
MAETVSDFLLRRLSEWGIKHIFGYPGDEISGILEALGRNEGLFDFIRVQHEETAAFMACAYAKFTGEVAVCLATSGRETIHLLNALYDAKADHQPVVAIVGQSARGDYQQEVDLADLFKSVASDYVQTVTDAAQLRRAIDRAVRIAHAGRTVTCIIIPKDVQDQDAVEKAPRMHSIGISYASTRILPAQEELQRAADVLNAGQRVAMLIGAGALQASAEVMEVAEILGCGVAKALLGKAALPDDLPYVTGLAGRMGTRPSWNMMQECDTFFMVGSGFPHSEFLPPDEQARGVQVDIDGRMLSLHYPMQVNLIGDSALTLRALIPLLQWKTDRSWREQIESDVRDWWGVLEKRAKNSAVPVDPHRVAWELSARLPDNSIITAETGTSASWYGHAIKLRPGMMGSVSGTISTVGCAVPYAISAKFAHPERVAVAFTGGEPMQMNSLDELDIVERYWKRWSDPRLIFVVLNSRNLNQVTWEAGIEEGGSRLLTARGFLDFPYARYADSIGLIGIRVDRPEDIGPAIDQAFTAYRPVVLEAHTHPDVPA